MEMILPLIALVSSIFAACAVVYSKIRPRFPIKVNCWFCHHDITVAYHERNSWDCPHCDQYNGFKEDGDYNKLIEEQYNVELNQEVSARSDEQSFKVVNKLCGSCTLNQQLKIQQLASFSPRNSDKFDEEVNRYSSHLEHVYRLCGMCDKHVKAKLSQDDRKHKPNILTWKLELSKKHFRTSKMFANVCKKIHRTVTYVGFFIVWVHLTIHSTYFCILNNNEVLVPEYWFPVSSDVHLISQVSCVFGIFCALPSFYSKSLNVGKSWKMLSVLMWMVMFLLPYHAHENRTEKLWISIALCLLASLEMVLALARSGRRLKKPRLRINERKIETAHVNNSSAECHLKKNPCDLDISKLDISTSPGKSRSSPPSSVGRSPAFIRPKPVISPSRFSPANISCSNGNLTKASWVAGGYWQSNNCSPPSPSFSPQSPTSFPLSRSSSQSSGIGSIQTGLFNRSPCDSRPGSPSGEIDRLSVFSDHLDHPRYAESNQHMFHDVSPSMYQRGGALSTVSSNNASLLNASLMNNTASSHWSWLPFLLGFSLAVNICVLAYFVFIHSVKV